MIITHFHKSKDYRIKIILLLCIFCAGSLQSYAKKIKQVHRIESSERTSASLITPKLQSTKVILDSLHAKKIRFSGYDKPAPVSKETFLISNFTDSIINKIGISITYLDLKDRMLHAREAEVECEIPPGETRIVAIPSWDLQHTFYYILGPEPKKTATPYKVVIRALWVER